MSTKNQSSIELHDELIAANTLLESYIMKNPKRVVSVLGGLIAFYGECSQSGLKSAMSTVNVTFASVALDVVKTCDLQDGEDGKQYLPVDANQMKNAIYYLSKLIEKLDPLSALIENNDNNPAFRMCKDAYCDVERVG